MGSGTRAVQQKGRYSGQAAAAQPRSVTKSRRLIASLLTGQPTTSSRRGCVVAPPVRVIQYQQYRNYLLFDCCFRTTIASLKSAISLWRVHQRGGCKGPLGAGAMVRKCERCGNPMDLFACVPCLGGLPELRTYRCPCCGDVETDAGAISNLQRGDVYGARLELGEARAA
jgi:hypothetical protein